MTSAEPKAEVTETLIIPNITKTNSDSCFIMHCFQENKDKQNCKEHSLTFLLEIILGVHQGGRDKVGLMAYDPCQILNSSFQSLTSVLEFYS